MARPHCKIPPHAVELMPGLWEWVNPKNGFTCMITHYSAHPERTQEWVNKVKPHYGHTNWEKEQEINFEITAGGARVFPHFTVDFIKPLMGKDNKYYGDTAIPIIRAWDVGGLLRPCIVWGVKTKNGELHILKEYMPYDKPLNEVIMTVKAISSYSFPKFTFEDIVDPYGGRARNFLTGENAVNIMRQAPYNLSPRVRQFNIKDGLNLLDLLIDKGKLLIDERLEIIKEGLLGGYVYDTRTQLPKDEQYYIHTLDCLRYIVTAYFTTEEILTPKTQNKDEQMTEEKAFENWVYWLEKQNRLRENILIDEY